MKKIIIVFIALLAHTALIAQEHLTFKGIPIEGSMKEFCKKLERKGIKQSGTNSKVTILYGDFAGKLANISVSSMDSGKAIQSVGVWFTSSDKWSNLAKDYEYYKKLYSKKYGNPSESREIKPDTIENNDALMQALYNGQISYFSKWQLSGGTIELSIIKSNSLKYGRIGISYTLVDALEAKIHDDLKDI
ncbi:MAG: hypothetical protein K2M11_07500 [Paramuribaculum sp.]|nr:hypothetical protein [Paramuribaculum sp.]